MPTKNRKSNIVGLPFVVSLSVAKIHTVYLQYKVAQIACRCDNWRSEPRTLSSVFLFMIADLYIIRRNCYYTADQVALRSFHRKYCACSPTFATLPIPFGTMVTHSQSPIPLLQAHTHTPTIGRTLDAMCFAHVLRKGNTGRHGVTSRVVYLYIVRYNKIDIHNVCVCCYKRISHRRQREGITYRKNCGLTDNVDVAFMLVVVGTYTVYDKDWGAQTLVVISRTLNITSTKTYNTVESIWGVSPRNPKVERTACEAKSEWLDPGSGLVGAKLRDTRRISRNTLLILLRTVENEYTS